MTTVINPVLTSETFNRHWDQNKYTTGTIRHLSTPDIAADSLKARR
jgi:hypothetical protein